MFEDIASIINHHMTVHPFVSPIDYAARGWALLPREFIYEEEA